MINVNVTTTSCSSSTWVPSRKSMRPLEAMKGPYRLREQNAQKSDDVIGRLESQMIQQPLGERFGMLPMHEMPAGDLLDDVLVLEHPGGVPIVRRLHDWII